MSPRRILVTSALPYANGHIHLGHLVEYIQTDVWVRFQKLMGAECIYLCADDTHGTAIMIRARAEGRPEEAVIADMHRAHVADFSAFGIEFDHYGSTNSAANRKLCGEVWEKLVAGGHVAEKEVTQLFDPEAGTFLADRFVKGTCPKCHSPDQYGDSCEKCQSTYAPTDLIDPKSTLSGATPVVKSAKHLFINIENQHDFLQEWTQTSGALQPEVANYLAGHFLGQPLRDWDVSRPAPYFGFEIPGTNGEHFWYVWFDAPIGYMASTAEWCEMHGQPLERWWKDPETEIHHFIGKDITYFHTLFWPAMLRAAGLTLPKKVHIHGFLTIFGEKMSKARGTFILASKYLEVLDPAYLRYYYATKLNARIDDLDLNRDEFVNRVNSDLVGKVVNIASRTARFVESTGLSPTYPDDGGLFQTAAAAGEAIAAFYEQGEYSSAMRRIMELAEAANRYLEEQAPWKLKSDPSQAQRLQQICTVGLNLFRQVVVYLSPVLPKLAEQVGALLNDPIKSWKQAASPLAGTRVEPFTHLMKRVDLKQMEELTPAVVNATPPSRTGPGNVVLRKSLVEENSGAANMSASSNETGPDAPQPTSPTEAVVNPVEGAPNAAPAAAAETALPPVEGAESLVKEPLAENVIAFDDFLKVDLRVGKVLSAEPVPKSTKLLKLSIQIGEPAPRTVFAGIQGVYDPATLVGRLVIVCVNLAPRKMPSGVSQGMVLAAGAGGKEIYVLSPDSGAQPGQRVH